MLFLGVLIAPTILATKAQAATFGSGHIDLFHVKRDGDRILLNTRVDGRQEYPAASVIIAVPGRAYTEKTKQLSGIGAAGWVIPQTQVSGIPWVGWDTNQAGEAIDLRFTQVSGPGQIFLFGEASGGIKSLLNSGINLGSGSVLRQDRPAHVHATWVFTAPGRYRLAVDACTPSGNCSGAQNYTFDIQGQAAAQSSQSKTNNQQNSGPQPNRTGGKTIDAANPGGGSGANLAAGENQILVPTNTHVHPNWIFTAAGEYELGLRFDFLKAGQPVSREATLKFLVGTPGNADDGHFDIGLHHENDQYQAAIRDDRVNPGKWTNPPDLTFGLTSAAETKAPKGLEFVANEGAKIWMISATQVTGVPWLGFNTQDEKLIKDAKTEVRITLTKATGPGRIAVFTQGNLGQLVDKLWFTAGDGTSAPAATPATPAQPVVAPTAELLSGAAAAVAVVGVGFLGYVTYRIRR